ncbi:hypothetical protein B0T19DRAFT_214068 [Cercophora scortea]|uniref:Uncharacterized protein n=1 Tax=Cercophora scortea TaxID=314031 RepID=A0AAE0IF18_9PEZI|nr:hypothetical protein B0T19DRAFT_214068 [Cercophora scortea]
MACLGLTLMAGCIPLCLFALYVTVKRLLLRFLYTYIYLYISGSPPGRFRGEEGSLMGTELSVHVHYHDHHPAA